MLPKFRTALELKEKHDKLPESSMFHKDQKSNQKEVNELLDEAVGTLRAPVHREAPAKLLQRFS